MLESYRIHPLLRLIRPDISTREACRMAIDVLDTIRLHWAELPQEQIPPFSPLSIEPMLLLNERVHYGTDQQLMAEYARAHEATVEKFSQSILATEIYVSVLGYPQLYIEGNESL